MRIIIADRQAATRSAVGILLASEKDMNIVGEAGEMPQILPLVEAMQPDVLLLDWELPGRAATELLPALRKLAPPLKVVALSGRPEARQAALQAGVDGFLSKGDSPARLLTILRAIQL